MLAADAARSVPICRRASVYVVLSANTGVCGTQAIHAVDPETLKVQKTITSDQSGAPLTHSQNKSRTWNDVAFVEVILSAASSHFLEEWLGMFLQPIL